MRTSSMMKVACTVCTLIAGNAFLLPVGLGGRACVSERMVRPRCHAVAMGLHVVKGNRGERGRSHEEEEPSAPFRVVPNFVSEERRRPKTAVFRDINNYRNSVLMEHSLEMGAMAWAEFTDFLRRTIHRNVQGSPFEFDRRQWRSSILKWWSRAIEADEQAKLEFYRLYGQGLQERDASERETVSVDEGVEDEWESIYVECNECNGNNDHGEQEILDCAIKGSWSCTYEEDQKTAISSSDSVPDTGAEQEGLRTPLFFCSCCLLSSCRELCGRGDERLNPI
ncbi:unnamed protein product [Discosporangium mesarthrocarpum]